MKYQFAHKGLVMNGMGRVRLFDCMIALVLVFAAFAVEVVAQDSSSGAPVKQTKTRFSDSSKTKQSGAANKPPRRSPPDLSACGPENVNYSVHLNGNPPPVAPPVPGKALVYFIHDSGGMSTLGYPTTLMALDGNWVGANHGDSYFPVVVTPGEHHVCSALQTSLFEGRVELTHFTAVAGVTYYFRTRLVLSRAVEMLEMEPVDGDEGRYLASSFRLSESKPKK